MNTQEDNRDPTNCPAETVYNLFKPLQPIMKRCDPGRRSICGLEYLHGRSSPRSEQLGMRRSAEIRDTRTQIVRTRADVQGGVTALPRFKWTNRRSVVVRPSSTQTCRNDSAIQPKWISLEKCILFFVSFFFLFII